MTPRFIPVLAIALACSCSDEPPVATDLESTELAAPHPGSTVEVTTTIGPVQSLVGSDVVVAANVAHVAYIDSKPVATLRYARVQGTTVTVETIDSGAKVLPYVVAIAVDSANTPWVVYRRDTGLRVVHRVNNVWTPVVDRPMGFHGARAVAAAMDSQDRLHVVFPGDWNDLHYGILDGTFTVTPVPTSGISVSQYHPLLLAIDRTDAPHLAFVQKRWVADWGELPSLVYTRRIGAAWQSRPASGIHDLTGTSVTAYDMALDGDDRARFVFVDRSVTNWHRVKPYKEKPIYEYNYRHRFDDGTTLQFVDMADTRYTTIWPGPIEAERVGDDIRVVHGWRATQPGVMTVLWSGVQKFGPVAAGTIPNLRAAAAGSDARMHVVFEQAGNLAHARLEPTPPELCTDGIRNGFEERADCGGRCTPCLPICEDGQRDGDETDVDCGGSCAGCGVGQTCQTAGDCACELSPATCAQACSSGTCRALCEDRDGDGRGRGDACLGDDCDDDDPTFFQHCWRRELFTPAGPRTVRVHGLLYADELSCNSALSPDGICRLSPVENPCTGDDCQCGHTVETKDLDVDLSIDAAGDFTIAAPMLPVCNAGSLCDGPGPCQVPLFHREGLAFLEFTKPPFWSCTRNSIDLAVDFGIAGDGLHMNQRCTMDSLDLPAGAQTSILRTSLYDWRFTVDLSQYFFHGTTTLDPIRGRNAGDEAGVTCTLDGNPLGSLRATCTADIDYRWGSSTRKVRITRTKVITHDIFANPIIAIGDTPAESPSSAMLVRLELDIRRRTATLVNLQYWLNSQRTFEFDPHRHVGKIVAPVPRP